MTLISKLHVILVLVSLLCLGRFMKFLICHLYKIVIWMSHLMIILRRNSWGVLMMFLLWLTMLMSLLISMFWMLNTMLLVLLLWEDLFLELLVPSLIWKKEPLNINFHPRKVLNTSL